MIGTIGTLIKNAPAILAGVQALTPKRWRGALNKVRTTAVAVGTASTVAAQPWDAGAALNGLSLWAVTSIGVPAPEPAVFIAPLLATAATFLATTAGTYIVGWATPEDADKLRNVET